MSAWMITDDHADFIATAYVRLIDPAADPQTIGRELLMENHASLAARYGDNDFSQGKAYRFREWEGELDRVWINKAAICADYQCCEHREWEPSASCKRLAQLVAITGGEPGFPASAAYNAAPWGIEHEHRPEAPAKRREPDRATQLAHLAAASPMRPCQGRTQAVHGLPLFDTALQPRLL